MTKTYNFYCDESTHLENDGMPYMIIAYVGTPYNQLKEHKEEIKQLKDKHTFGGEIKWTNLSNSQYEFYKDLIEYFFRTDLFFRAIIVKKDQINKEKEEFSYDDFYYQMYYELLHHNLSMEDTYNVYLDIKDTRSHKKVRRLKEILSYNASIRNLQSMHSKESTLMQLTDVIMGAINYKLRGETKMLAKTKLIQKIEKECLSSLDKATTNDEKKLHRFFIDLK